MPRTTEVVVKFHCPFCDGVFKCDDKLRKHLKKDERSRLRTSADAALYRKAYEGKWRPEEAPAPSRTMIVPVEVPQELQSNGAAQTTKSPWSLKRVADEGDRGVEMARKSTRHQFSRNDALAVAMQSDNDEALVQRACEIDHITSYTPGDGLRTGYTMETEFEEISDMYVNASERLRSNPSILGAYKGSDVDKKDEGSGRGDESATDLEYMPEELILGTEIRTAMDEEHEVTSSRGLRPSSDTSRGVICSTEPDASPDEGSRCSDDLCDSQNAHADNDIDSVPRASEGHVPATLNREKSCADEHPCDAIQVDEPVPESVTEAPSTPRRGPRVMYTQRMPSNAPSDPDMAYLVCPFCSYRYERRFRKLLNAHLDDMRPGSCKSRVTTKEEERRWLTARGPLRLAFSNEENARLTLAATEAKAEAMLVKAQAKLEAARQARVSSGIAEMLARVRSESENTPPRLPGVFFPGAGQPWRPVKVEDSSEDPVLKMEESRDVPYIKLED
ncbi:hypothetical protein YB2330_001970 [Saitoella coloradoensis]